MRPPTHRSNLPITLNNMVDTVPLSSNYKGTTIWRLGFIAKKK